MTTRKEPIKWLDRIFGYELLNKMPTDAKEDLYLFLNSLKHNQNPQDFYFINLEPETFITYKSALKVILSTKSNVVVELTERLSRKDIPELIKTALSCRAILCLDDVCFNTPVELFCLKPDFIKLDFLKLSTFDELVALIKHVRTFSNAILIAEKVQPEQFHWLEPAKIHLYQSLHL